MFLVGVVIFYMGGSSTDGRDTPIRELCNTPPSSPPKAASVSLVGVYTRVRMWNPMMAYNSNKRNCPSQIGNNTTVAF